MPWPALFIITELPSPELWRRIGSVKLIVSLIRQGHSFEVGLLVCGSLSQWSQHLSLIDCAFRPWPDKQVAAGAWTWTVCPWRIEFPLVEVPWSTMAAQEFSLLIWTKRVPYYIELSDSSALLAACIVLTMFVIICLRKHSKWRLCAPCCFCIKSIFRTA